MSSFESSHKASGRSGSAPQGYGIGRTSIPPPDPWSSRWEHGIAKDKHREKRPDPFCKLCSGANIRVERTFRKKCPDCDGEGNRKMEITCCTRQPGSSRSCKYCNGTGISIKKPRCARCEGQGHIAKSATKWEWEKCVCCR